MAKVISIHQPDFMPWLGFFDKINNADTWVVLDHTINNPRDSHFWCRRVNVLINSKPHWFSTSLNKPKGKIGLPINEMTINENTQNQFSKQLKGLEQSYCKHPYFNEIFPLIENYVKTNDTSLLKNNMKFINTVLEKLEIRKEVVFSSSLGCVRNSTELLIEITQKVKGDTYLAGGGAGGYQEDGLFAENGIELRYNNFQHPKYPQKGTDDFQSGLSTVDSLMNIGFEGVKNLLVR